MRQLIAPRRATRDVHEHDRQAELSERGGKRGRVGDDIANRMDSGSATIPFCKSMTMSAVFRSSVMTGISYLPEIGF